MRRAFLSVMGVLLGVSSLRAETFLYLVRQWPTTYCSVEAHCSTSPDSEAFSIHGLWPNYDRGGYPENCTNEKYDRSAVSQIRSEMTRVWESYSEPNDKFWAHEWECHGTCTNFGQEEFFKTVLNLNQKYNLEDALRAADIVPDDRKLYSTNDISDAIKQAYGAEPTVRCANRRQGGDQLLDSIFMCFNENLEAEDCEDACPSGACEKVNCRQALYPPVESDDAVLEQRLSSAETVDEDQEAFLSRRLHRSQCPRGDHGINQIVAAA